MNVLSRVRNVSALTVRKVDGKSDDHPDYEAHPGEPVEVDNEGDVEEDGKYREEGHEGYLVAKWLTVLLVLVDDPHDQTEEGANQTEEKGDQLVIDALGKNQGYQLSRFQSKTFNELY